MREEEKQSKNENFTVFLEAAAAINSTFTTYTETETETERMANEEIQAGVTQARAQTWYLRFNGRQVLLSYCQAIEEAYNVAALYSTIPAAVIC